MLINPYQFQTVAITRIIPESKEAVSILVNRPNGYAFKPGQHVIMRVTIDGIAYTRQYSFSSVPSDTELRFTIVKSPQGVVSNWAITQAKKSDAIEISQPFTGPLVHKITRGKICMIAGGSGIAPLMSLLKANRLRPKPLPITIVYSTKSQRRCFTNELVESPDEEVIVHLSDKAGHLSQRIIAQASDSCSSIFICGSRDFVQTMRVFCENTASRAKIFAESFTL